MGGEGFLDRWSRRKRAAAEPETEETLKPAETPPEPAGTGQAEAPGLSEEEIAALPPVEVIGADTDLRQYLRKGVPRALRNAALRRKWLLNTTIRDHRDIAVDYAWDWNVPGGVPGDGGPLDRDMVARMAERLLTPREPAPTAAETPGGGEAVAAAPQDGGEGSAAAPRAATPTPPPTADLPQDSAVARPDAPARDGDDEDSAPQRRHGGAAPV